MSETKPSEQHDDEFDAAFDEEEVPVTPEPETDDAPKEEEAAAAVQPPEDTQEAGDFDDAGTEAPDPAVEPEDTASASKDDGTPAENDWETRYQQLEQRTRSWEGRISKAEREAQQARADAERYRQELEAKKGAKKEEGADTDNGEPEAESTDPEIQELLSEYPDIAGPMLKHFTAQLKRTQNLSQQQVEQAQAQFKQELNQNLEPMRQREAESARVAHETALSEAHPDWQDVAQSGALTAWIERQPDYLREGMQRVVEGGTTTQVVDLLNQYKSANNPQPKSSSKPLGAAEAVRGRRGPPPRSPADKDDFDSAWDEAPN